ncbi:MAG: hypothetical protein ABSC93_13060 [Bryobacteraceae bacterium]
MIWTARFKRPGRDPAKPSTDYKLVYNPMTNVKRSTAPARIPAAARRLAMMGE